MIVRFPSARWSAPRRPAVRLLVLVGVFLGLFAMHGLGGHGTAHQMGTANASQMALMSNTADVNHTGETAAGHEAMSGAVEPDDEDQTMAMVGLCLAVLLMGFLLLHLLLRPRRALLFLRARAPRLAPVPRAAARDPDPPCIYKLSVLRT